MQRSLLPAEPGLVGFAQTFHGSDTRVVVTHGAFLVTRVEVRAGRIVFPLASRDVFVGERFVLFLPPRSVLPMRFESAEVTTTGVAGFGSVALHGAVALKDEGIANRINKVEVSRLLRAPVLHSLNADECVAEHWTQARRLMHDVLAHPAPVGHVARKLGVSVETLCRGFSRAFGLSAKQYCHRARLFEAVLRLAAGTTIVESAFAAGFGDVKRFYQQFRRILGTTPGEYVRVKKRQDVSSDPLV
ncbi:helix-turn-helix domain-containing protein [Verrucomicrobiota bacterium sgz303538]